MKMRVKNSKPHDTASIATIAAAIVAASLMSFATIDSAAAGKGGDSRAPAPRAATATTDGVSPHIKAINQSKTWRGNKTDEPCTSIHCNPRPPHDHQH